MFNSGLNQPEDKGIVLADILESGVVDRDKSHCIDANYFKGGNLKSYFEKNRRQLVFQDRPCKLREKNQQGTSLCHHVATATDINGNESNKRIYAKTGKAPTLTTMGGGHREPRVYIDTGKYRKLTPRECMRLQTIPEHCIDVLLEVGISNTQLYKMTGNGWTMKVISHIFKQL